MQLELYHPGSSAVWAEALFVSLTPTGLTR
jgi:hypothetical protein